MRRISIFAVMLALLGLALSCGSGNNAEDNTVAAPPSDFGQSASPAASGAEAKINDHGTKTFTKQAFELEIEQDNEGSDYYFDPTFIKSPGGATATVKLHNEGSVQHTFTIDALNINEELAPDEKKTVVVELGTETRYEFYCRFHEAMGMRGAFMPH
jgi:plastocyanin